MKKKEAMWPLIVSSIGIVFGDIGTSPLYALKICFSSSHLEIIPSNILGLCSLFAWTLLLVVSLKYVYIILKVDNQGEGGLFALAALCSSLQIKKIKNFSMFFGIVGIALFFSDGILTPAISVLGALEGLNTVTSYFNNYILVISVFILIALFFFQKKGTGTIGNFFGPIMILWFLVMAALGLRSILQMPEIISALNPCYAIYFFTHNHWVGFWTMGFVILVVTGVEALYADLGHFGKKPIQYAWTFFVFPSLLLNYLGQGALLLRDPLAVSNPFYLLAPSFLIWPLIILATIATIIAAQAVISGIFSMGWQAIMLNYLPRMHVIYTSHLQIGRVFIPVLNIIMFLLTLLTIIIFRNTHTLSIAYGFSIAGCMLLTTVFIMIIMRYKHQWNKLHIALFFAPIVSIDSIFFFTNLAKIVEGAWFTLSISAICFYIIYVWRTGQHAKNEQEKLRKESLFDFLKAYRQQYVTTLPRTAIYLTRHENTVPKALELHCRHHVFLHEKNIFIHIRTHNVPWVSFNEKYTAQQQDLNTYCIKANYGFKEIPDLERIIHWAEKEKILTPHEEISFLITHQAPKTASKDSPTDVLKGFSEKLYFFLANNAIPATEFFKLPFRKVLEIVVRYEI